jgi:hypothetical protein
LDIAITRQARKQFMALSPRRFENAALTVYLAFESRQCQSLWLERRASFSNEAAPVIPKSGMT